jgi:cytochrome c-type biogenesis protein CcmH
MMDPASNAGRTVAQQIESSRNELDGRELVAQQPGPDPDITSDNPDLPGNNPALASTNESLNIDIGLDENMPPPPANTVLFVFVHPAGQRGMPLAVRRIDSPELPLSISLTDADALRPGSSLADHPQLDISARLSLSGIANAASGDYQANLATVDSGDETRIVLNLNQRVP